MKTNNSNILVITNDNYVLEVFDVLSSIIKECKIYTAESFDNADEIIKKNPMDLIIIDLVIPELEICKKFQKHPNIFGAYYIFMINEQNNTKVQIMTNCNMVQDFITKPFDIKELELILISKLKFIRQSKNSMQKSIEDKFRLEQNSKSLFFDNKKIDLTNMEYKLFEYFMAHHDDILETEQISMFLWGDDNKSALYNLRVLIHKLRTKIEVNHQKPVYIVNSKGNGYIFNSLGLKV